MQIRTSSPDWHGLQSISRVVYKCVYKLEYGILDFDIFSRGDAMSERIILIICGILGVALGVYIGTSIS